ncbi:MAG: MGMT family protein [Spirochaetaceae bacterium]|nr:MGMT family protein [Spirochaetaceae bacterium]
MTSFSNTVKEIVRSIPSGKVLSYGQVAALAGNHRAARQVSWILRNSSDKEGLPWHRVINSRGSISLPEHMGGLIQRGFLEEEGIIFKKNGTVEKTFFWNGS